MAEVMSREALISELNVALKQSGERAVMFNEERLKAQAKGIIHLCAQSREHDEGVQSMANAVWNDFYRRVGYCIAKFETNQ